MSHQLQIRSGASIPDVADPQMGRTGENMDSVFVRIHRLLRGRYLWAIGLGLILCVAGAFAGFKATQPLWTCSAIVQVKMNRDVILYSSPENQSTQSPEVIKETQIALMRSQRVINMAMDTDEWKRLGRPLSDDNITDFMHKLAITPQGRSEMINVSFTDPDAIAASYWSVLQQPRSAWSSEVELRPWVETF